MQSNAKSIMQRTVKESLLAWEPYKFWGHFTRSAQKVSCNEQHAPQHTTSQQLQTQPTNASSQKNQLDLVQLELDTRAAAARQQYHAPNYMPNPCTSYNP